ncbi:unnamed protein product [Effrenium voratum]|nr:unnamed protein product [Effrenium voratum]
MLQFPHARRECFVLDSMEEPWAFSDLSQAHNLVSKKPTRSILREKDNNSGSLIYGPLASESFFGFLNVARPAGSGKRCGIGMTAVRSSFWHEPPKLHRTIVASRQPGRAKQAQSRGCIAGAVGILCTRQGRRGWAVKVSEEQDSQVPDVPVPSSVQEPSSEAGDEEASDSRFAPVQSVEENDAMETSETEEFLSQLGLSLNQLRKVKQFWSYSGQQIPPLLRCQMVAEYLEKEVGLNSEQVRRTIADCPEVLEVFSVETLREKVRFLEVEVGAEKDLPEIVAAYPQVFSRPVLTTLRPALEFWLGRGEVDPEELPKLLRKHAAQMWMRPEVLELKLRFAKEVMGLSLEKVLACPMPFFRLSMERTVAPRHFFVLHKQASGLNLGLADLVGGSDAAFCKKLSAEPEEFKTWMEEWPFSEQARALSWLTPPKRSRTRHGASRPSYQGKSSQKNKFQKRGQNESKSVSKDRRRNRRWGRSSSKEDSEDRRAEKALQEEMWSRAELYREVRLRLLYALLQRDFNGRQYDDEYCNQALDIIADQRRVSFQIRALCRAVQSAKGGHAGRTAALRQQLAVLKDRRDRREAGQASTPETPPSPATTTAELEEVQVESSASAETETGRSSTRASRSRSESLEEMRRKKQVIFVEEVTVREDCEADTAPCARDRSISVSSFNMMRQPSQDYSRTDEQQPSSCCSRCRCCFSGKNKKAKVDLIREEWKADPSLQTFGNQES